MMNLAEANEVVMAQRPSRSTSTTDMIESVLVVKGETTDASASERAMPT